MHSSLAPFYYFQVKTETSRQPLIPGDGVLQQTSQIPSRVITPWESFWPSRASCCSTQKASTPEGVEGGRGGESWKIGISVSVQGGHSHLHLSQAGHRFLSSLFRGWHRP